VIPFAGISHLLTDGRLHANAIAFYGAAVIVMLVVLVLRRLLSRDQPVSWTGLPWLDTLGEEAASHARRLLFYVAAGSIVILSIAGLGYHFLGGDIREDLGAGFNRLTPETTLQLGMQAAECGIIVLAALAATWLVRRLRPALQKYAIAFVAPFTNHRPKCDEDTPHAAITLAPRLTQFAPPAEPETDTHHYCTHALDHWFTLFECFTVAGIRLVALWQMGRVAGFGAFADATVGLILCVGTILVIARLATLASRVVIRVAVTQGDLRLALGSFRHYWERLHDLLPVGGRCLEWSIYLIAVSLCFRQLHHATASDPTLPSTLRNVADFGPLVVHCIGIFFATRVAIDILQVALNEGFGLYLAEGGDAKGRTLVPLLHSFCQYVLYFGAGVMMLGHLGVNTQPILAGAGIIGLAVGLGAQSLVSDVVSGFFILFESQYFVGDYVQIGDACGIVEEVGIRNTKVRDAQGKLYIIPNGQVKGVVSYSKGFVNAVVDVKVPAGSDLEGVVRAMTEAGRRLRLMHKDVLADTMIHGLVELGTSDMTVRAVTRVQPARHLVMQNEYRRILKIIFDEEHLQMAKAA
jgi:small-conductance mechanosensitive channel